MKLDEYFKLDSSLSARELAEKSGVSYTTIKAARKGMKIRLYEVAKAISEATRPAPGKKPLVTVEDLCE